ncbi:MAG: GNAT family N-acetyltransferase [Akkermansiaceae bacterium]|nr:GNAT family N-acetyltransferase [Armatimonadota bacterium]
MLAVDPGGVFGGYCNLHLGSRPVRAPPPKSGGLPGRPGMPVKLWRLYTAREWQGRGVGALLLEHAATVARERGGSVFWLTVNTENTGAVRFYTRNGFVRTGFASFDLGGEIQRDFVMERVL